ncbi:Hypothetical_protein [Hexamita inflata]|uniref:Hypothetical_protein n=1 Tax=Hexamita inflata TaxID=28002 RepID=A0AA86P2F3_9EUKA|nr:Hypothetical protein HINF_LOCUS18021 [Hexamita inflata]
MQGYIYVEDCNLYCALLFTSYYCSRNYINYNFYCQDGSFEPLPEPLPKLKTWVIVLLVIAVSFIMGVISCILWYLGAQKNKKSCDVENQKLIQNKNFYQPVLIPKFNQSPDMEAVQQYMPQMIPLYLLEQCQQYHLNNQSDNSLQMSTCIYK